MFAHPATRAPAISQRQTASYAARITMLVLLGLGLGLAGCGSLPPAPLAGADPSNPGAPVRAQTYRSTVGPYAGARPAEAGAWQDTNDRAAPQVQP
jgi:hypothetical protein